MNDSWRIPLEKYLPKANPWGDLRQPFTSIRGVRSTIFGSNLTQPGSTTADMSSLPATYRPPSKWRIRRWWGRFPLWFRLSFVLLCLVGLAGGSYYWFVKRAVAREKQQVAVAWGAFEKAVGGLNEEAMRQALDELAALQPDDPLVRRRKQALDDGNADPSDASMCAVTLMRHFRDQRWAEAEREADKRLAHAEDDWLCRCVKVAAALNRKDRTAAIKLIETLPDPSLRGAGVNPTAALFAAQLYRQLGRDPAPIRQLLRGVIVDRLRSLVADSDPPPVTVLLLRCYLEAFHPTGPNPPSLALAVADIPRLLSSATATAAAANNVPILLNLGQVCEELFLAYDWLLRDKLITPDQHKAVRQEHAEKTKAIWKAARERTATESTVYAGLARAATRDKNLRLAVETVLEGLVATGGTDAPLLAQLTVLLQKEEQPELAFQIVAAAADKSPANIPLQLIAAEAATAIDRQDKVLNACERVYKQDPRHPIAARLEAAARLRTGDAHGALQVLSERIGEDRLCQDATTARWYARSRLEAVKIGLEPFLRKCEDAAGKQGNPLPIAGVLAGILDAKFDPDAVVLAEQTATRALERWSNDPNLLRLRAAALGLLAERVVPAWNETRVRPAVNAFTELKLKGLDDAETATGLAWIRLKGEANPARAVADAAPLILADERGDVRSLRQLEVLGAVYLADEKLDQAIRVLELAARTGRTPNARIHLALAYTKRGRFMEARATLDLARSTRTGPWTDQEDADYRLAVETLQRGSR